MIKKITIHVLFTVLISLLFISCPEQKVKEEITRPYELNGYETVYVGKVQNYKIFSYEYSSDLNSVGYAKYGTYKGYIVLQDENENYVPVLNIIEEKETSFDEKLYLKKKEGDVNKFRLYYYIQLHEQKAAGFGDIEIEYEYINGKYEVSDYVSNIESRFREEEDSDISIPDMNGNAIYKSQYPKNDFLKLLNDKQFGF